MSGFKSDLLRFIVSTIVLTACALALAIYVHDSVNSPEEHSASELLLSGGGSDDDSLSFSQAGTNDLKRPEKPKIKKSKSEKNGS